MLERSFIVFVSALLFAGICVQARAQETAPAAAVKPIASAIPAMETLPVAEALPAETEIKTRGTGKLYQLFAEDIEKTVSDALQQDGAGAKVQATVVGRRSLPLYESDKPLDVAVKTLRFDAQTGKWSANLLFTQDGKVESAMPVSGRYQEMVAIPVLKRRVESNEVIGEADIEMKDHPLARARKGIVLDKAKIVGKSPRRSISASRAIREDELAGASLVAKDALVRMRFDASGITVETTGQALDAGTKGDLVRVKNLDSKAVVQGVVEDKNLVRVAAGAQIAEPSKAELATETIKP